MRIFKRTDNSLCLILLLILAFTLRLLPVSAYYRLPQQTQEKISYFSDARGYEQYAQLFVKEGWAALGNSHFSVSGQYLLPGQPYTAFRTPLYPLFLSVVYDFFGLNPLPVILIQILLDTITTFLVFQIALTVFKKESVGLLAAFFYAISPLAIFFSSSLYADSFFTFFFTLSIFCFVWSLERNTYWRFLLAGFLLGLSTLIKPVSIYFVLVLCVTIFFIKRRDIKPENNGEQTGWRKIKIAVIVCVGFLITIAPWQLRNLDVFGHYSLTFQQGRELLVFNVGTCKAWQERVDPETVFASGERAYAGITDPFTRSDIEQKAALDYILNNVPGYIGCEGAGIRNFFLTPNIFVDRSVATRVSNTFLDSLALSQKTEIVLSVLYSSLLWIEYGVIIAGLTLLLIRKKNIAFSVLVILTLLYFSLTAGTEGYYRYRYPITPLIAVIFAASLVELSESVQNVIGKTTHTAEPQ